MRKLSLAVLISAAIHGYVISKQPKHEVFSPSSGGQASAPSIAVMAINTSVATASPEPTEIKPETAAVKTKSATKPRSEKLTEAPKKSKEENSEKPTDQPNSDSQLAQSQSTPTQQTEKAQPDPIKPATKPDDKRQPITEEQAVNASVSQLDSKPQSEQGLSQVPRLNSQPRFSQPPAAPIYPRLAKKRGLEGTVLVEVWIDQKGQQTKQQISSSSGVKSLDKAALKAVQKWRFKALIVEGQAQASRALIPIKFKLS
ncbi:TonB family protein [Agarivorans sp. MS3-6]